MSWNYSRSDETGSEPSLPILPTEPPAPSPDRDDAASLARAGQELSRMIPAAFADLLQRPDLSPEQKLELVRELVELNESPSLTEQDVAAASPAIRAAATALKEQKEAVAAQEQELATMMLAPALAILAHQAQPHGLNCGRFECADLGQEIGPALDRIFAAGPSQTPAQTLPAREAGLMA